MSEHEATLERRIYARLDESLGPINEALDAVNTRLDVLAAQYEALSTKLQQDSVPSSYNPLGLGVNQRLNAVFAAQDSLNHRLNALDSLQSSHAMALGKLHADHGSFKETADRVFDTFEAQFQTLERRDKQVELQLERLAADIVALHRLAAGDRNTLSERLDDLTKDVVGWHKVSESARKRHEELTHALEDHVHKVSGEAMLNDQPAIDWSMDAKQADITSRMLSTLRNEISPTSDEYEVDGHPATKAEYEAAENDSKAPHTTRHVHRPFSDPEPCAAPAEPVHDIGWAMKQLAADKKVRRTAWNVHVYWVVYCDTIRLHHSGEPLICRDDIEATDWEIVP